MEVKVRTVITLREKKVDRNQQGIEDVFWGVGNIYFQKWWVVTWVFISINDDALTHIYVLMYFVYVLFHNNNKKSV